MAISSRRPTVLVIDDDPFNLSLMDGVLNKDYTIKTATNGADALNFAFTSPPDLTLIDVMMPDMDGFEVCRQLKKNAATMHVPVIFITAKNETKDEELGFAVGASDFIHKPISAPILAARVRTHLKVKLMQDYLRNENTMLLKDAGEKSTELQILREFMWGADKLARR